MNYKVYANGKAVAVRHCRIFQAPYNSVGDMEYVMLEADGKAELEIESAEEVSEVIARPLSAGVTPELRNGRIYVTVDVPSKLSIEINGSFVNNLMIFADPDRYSDFEPDENTIVFQKGVHNADTVMIDKDGTKLYLEDGAILNGNIRAENCRDITICGKGMVCMEKYTYEMRKDFARSIDIYQCKNVTIRDIIINDSNDWSLRINGCENVLVENVKIFGCRGNSDGVDVCGSRNVTVTDIFTRVWDDSFVVKALGTGNAENILFKDSILWNDFARPMEVGVELRADMVTNIRFENIDVIHSTTGYPIMGIHHGDHARVSDIVFDHIRVEDAPGAQLFDIRIADSVWNRDDAMGDIKNITFSNVSLFSAADNRILPSNSRIEGYSAEHDIQNVRFHNIAVNGKAVKSAETLGLDIRNFVRDVSVTSDLEEEALRIAAEITAAEGFVLGSDGMYHGKILVRLTNQNEQAAAGIAWLAIAPKHMESEREIRYSLPAGGSAEYIFDATLQPGKYVYFLKSNNLLENIQLYLSLDAVVHKGGSIAERPLYKFRNYYGEDGVSLRMSADDEGIVLMSETGGGETKFVIYTALPVSAAEGEVLFSVEETDFGEVCALVKSGEKYAAAPQLRCPLEIIYVFKNEPKVGEIKKTRVTLRSGEAKKISFGELGLGRDARDFLIEIAAETGESKGLRYPYTLFHSTMPESTAHMFGRMRIIG